MRKVDNIHYEANCSGEWGYIFLTSDEFPEISMCGTTYCDYLILKWRQTETRGERQMVLLGMKSVVDESNIACRIESWYSVNIIEALTYVNNNVV